MAGASDGAVTADGPNSDVGLIFARDESPVPCPNLQTFWPRPFPWAEDACVVLIPGVRSAMMAYMFDSGPVCWPPRLVVGERQVRGAR